MRQELEDGVNFISAPHRMHARFGPQTTRRQQIQALDTVRFAVGLNNGPIREGFRIDPEVLNERIGRESIGALLISSPCNPTGMVIQGDELSAWVRMARTRGCTLLMDEFYSHYIYTPGATGPVSSAAFVGDVDRDPVVIFDGLTKCFRYPGWRVGWVVAPQAIIRELTAAGSFLDGGASRPIQRAVVDVLEPGKSRSALIGWRT